MYHYIINIMDAFILSNIMEKMNILQLNLNKMSETTRNLDVKNTALEEELEAPRTELATVKNALTSLLSIQGLSTI